MPPQVSHTTLANSVAGPLGYEPPGPGLGVDGAPQGGGHTQEFQGNAVATNAILAAVERIQVRRPWFDIRWVLRDWNGLGSLDTFDRGARRRGTVRADNNRASTVTGLAFDVAPTIERGSPGSWDEGTAIKAKAGSWW